MTISIASWVIPVILTLLCIVMIYRPYHRAGWWDFGEVVRVLWLIPIGFIWAAYFGILLLVRGAN